MVNLPLPTVICALSRLVSYFQADPLILSNLELTCQNHCGLLLGKMWVNKLGRSRCTLQAEISLGDRLVTTATQVGFFIDLTTMRPMAVPEELKELYDATR